MSSIVISGDTSGSITLASPAVAGSNTVTMPAASGVCMVSGNMPAFSAYASTDQTPSANTWTKVNYNTEIFDTNNNYDPTTNYRFTPTVAGYYQINSFVTFASNSATNADTFLAVYKNGSIYSSVSGRALESRYSALTVAIVVSANGTTDYFEIYVKSSVTGYLAQNSTLGNFSGSMVRGA
jgi:hypothetical protein